MKRLFFLKPIFICVILTFFACSGEGDGTWGYQYANVKMTNNSSEEIHMWVTGESMDASNKLAPGASRTKKVEFKFYDKDVSKTLNIYAGKDGDVLFNWQGEHKPESCDYSASFILGGIAVVDNCL